MKNFLLLCLLAALIFPVSLRAQVTSVTVETYYISDGNDSTDTDGSAGIPDLNLKAGSKTYRVYINLVPGSRLRAIYGDTLHALKIKSTENFFNNRDRGMSFGKDIDNTKLLHNTVALDTWLTLGRATKKHYGIQKIKDSNGTILHPGNDGGSSGITELLMNNDAAAGIPLTQEDGLIHDSLVTDSIIAGQWGVDGFADAFGNDTTMFGQDSVRSEFVSNHAVLRQTVGVRGPVASDNSVLVAQLTTHGDISFELNVEVFEPGSALPVKYVSKFAEGEVNSDSFKLSPYLMYPPVCGCTDPNFLEYSPTYACNNSDSCRTRIVFGCMDALACNYNTNANFNISSLCCYPGYCNDRDISVVCPSLNDATKRFNLYPNPAHSDLTFHISPDNDKEVKYFIYDALGKLMLEKNLGAAKGTIKVDISTLNTGVHLFRIFTGDASESKMFLKK